MALPNGGGEVAVSVKEKDSNVEMLQPLPEDKAMEVSFTGVSCWVPRMFGAPSTLASLKSMSRNVSLKSISALPSQKKLGAAEQAAAANMRQVLYNVTGSVKPGQLLALMGPSGGGKTTLLSILGGRTPKMAVTEGDVLFNGAPLNKRAKRQTGFVMQDDLLYETLTVYETLYFAAMLRLPSHMTKAQKKERVETVIKALGLTRCRDTIIGGFFRRGVSGGERKRVSVGHELLINPSVLLLDEPTSGLDSTTARNLLQLLRDLASSGRAIVTTIHQPSSRLYQQLDSVLLLSQGHVIYYGEGAAAAEWFDQLGVPLPYGVNVADFILDIASGEIQGKERSDEVARTYLIECSEAFLARHPVGYRSGQQLEVPGGRASMELREPTAAVVATRLGSGKLAEDESEGSSPSAANGVHFAEHAAEAAAAVGPGPLSGDERGAGVEGPSASKRGMLTRSNTSFAASRAGSSRWGATYWTQLQVLFIRSVRVRRFETLSKQDFCQFLIVGAICGCIWWQVGRGDTVYSAQNALGLLFFEALFLSFRVLFTALFTFPNEFKMMLKERASGMYRLSAFYLARTASDLPMDCTVPSLFIIMIYFMAGMRGGGYFFANWAAILLSSLVAQSFGLLIGATVMVPKTAQTIAAVLMLGFMLVGGFYVQNIPSWISWLKWISFMTYAFDLVNKIEFSGRTLFDCGTGDYQPADPANDPSCTPVSGPSLQEALHLNANPDQWPYEALVLAGFLIVFRVLVYVALRRKTAAK